MKGKLILILNLSRLNPKDTLLPLSVPKVRWHTTINRADFVSWCMLYTRTKVTRCIRDKMTMCFREWTIKSHSPEYEIGPINRSV